MIGISWELVVTVVSTALTLTAVLGVLFSTYERRRASRYDGELRRVELESMRASIERSMYELSRRQLATESRWRDANHLLVDSQGYQESALPGSRVELTPFLRGAGLTIADLRPDSELVMVLTPFNSEFDATFDLVAKACRTVGLKAVRGDEEFVSSDIMRHVLGLLVRARLVIANVDGRNPNVFYELGIAHALSKATILIGSSSIDLPFDVRSRKIVLSDDPAALENLLVAEISRSLVKETPLD